jgi:hypothetical protein
MIEKFVSPFIKQQFPQFYQEEGPNFIAFIQAYYEWAEQTDLTDSGSGIIGKSRSILEYLDIDTTQQQFIDHFINTYINSIPKNILLDKALLIKHVLELYRSKGSPRAYKLLFRMLFNEDIDIYYPGQYLFKPSDNSWIVPTYIEITDNPYIMDLIGNVIYNSSGTAEAVVENAQQKNVNSKIFNVLYISAIKGTFKYGEKILSKNVPSITLDNAPKVIGSLTAITVLNGGFGFKVGDELSIFGSGVDGKARVKATINENGKVFFTLVDGGSGFSLTPNIVVAPTYNFNITNVQGRFVKGDKIYDLNTGATATITRSDTTFIEAINYSGNFRDNDTLFSTLNLGLSGSNGTFSVGNIIKDQTTGANGVVVFANSSYVQLKNFSNFSGGSQIYFEVGDVVANGSIGATVYSVDGSQIGGNAVITSVIGGAGSGAGFAVGGLINQELYLITSTDIITNYVNTSLDQANAGVGFNVNISNQSGVFTIGGLARSSANVVVIEGLINSANVCSVGETLSNSSLGISGLYVYDYGGANNTVIASTTGTDVTLQNANLKSGIILTSNISSSQIKVVTVDPKATITANATIFSQNTSVIGVQFTANVSHGYYIHGATITDVTTGHTAIVNNTIRTSNWGPFSGVATTTNLDTPLHLAFASTQKQVGTIAYLSNINPGSGYVTVPYIDVNDYDISTLQQVDALGRTKGHNAVVQSNILNADGIVTAVDVIDSGFGYSSDIVSLMGASSEIAVSGFAVVIDHGKNKGYWTSEKSFISDLMKIEDSNYYQNYSYEIAAKRMFDTYKDLISKLVHPSGVALFGKYRYRDYQLNTFLPTDVYANNISRTAYYQTIPWANSSGSTIPWANSSSSTIPWVRKTFV